MTSDVRHVRIVKLRKGDNAYDRILPPFVTNFWHKNNLKGTKQEHNHLDSIKHTNPHNPLSLHHPCW